MNPNTPKTSARLVRAAAAEHEELDRHRGRLIARREELRAQLDEIERALVEVDERAALLDRITPAPASGQVATPAVGSVAASSEAPFTSDGDELLRGTAIRETAVRLLATSPNAAQPVHYKALYELLRKSGYVVAGKDPVATFLTQLSRSPVIRKTTKAGVYQLEPDAPVKLRRQLVELQTQVRSVTGNPATTDNLVEIRQRRDQVLAEVARVERALDEASRVLVQRDAAPARGAA